MVDADMNASGLALEMHKSRQHISALLNPRQLEKRQLDAINFLEDYLKDKKEAKT